MDVSPALVAPSRLWAGFVGLTMALLAGLVAFTASAGLIDSMPLATVAAVLAAGATAGWCATRPALPTHLRSVPRVFRVAFVTGAVVVLGPLAILGTFIIDPNVAIWPAGGLRP